MLAIIETFTQKTQTTFEMQAYLVPFVTKVVSIFDPNSYVHCKHIWSMSSKLLQSYVVRPYRIIRTKEYQASSTTKPWFHKLK